MKLCNVPYTFAKLREQNRWLMNAGVVIYIQINSLKAIPFYLNSRQFLKEREITDGIDNLQSHMSRIECK